MAAGPRSQPQDAAADEIENRHSKCRRGGAAGGMLRPTGHDAPRSAAAREVVQIPCVAQAAAAANVTLQRAIRAILLSESSCNDAPG
jgi:hypothetical protein